MKKWLLILLVAGSIGGGGFAYYRHRSQPAAPTVNTAPVTRGDVVDTVGATGTLQAVTTVQVGTQVSGTIQVLYADFNSLVRKGQVLARLDPSLFETQIEQARANLIRAEADLDRLRVSLEDARTKLARANELSGRQLIPQSELETAQVSVRSIEAQIRSSEAQVTQARASLNQNQVNLAHTVITAPIDGIVISRNVDVGQTVAASMQAPTLFVLAADLTKMQVVANLDESDVGRIRPGQHVSFRVDAYPAEDFTGSVSQVRLQPIVQQNVVTYATVIDVPNPDLKLKPGMTANVNVEIRKRSNVVRIPNGALRFRPTNEMFAALGQSAPDPAELRASIAADSRNREGGASGSAGQGGLGERLRSMTPEERERLREQARGRGGAPGAGQDLAGRGRGQNQQPPGRRAGGSSGGNGEERATDARTLESPESATTFDALFAPLPSVESVGRVWVYADGRLTPLRVRTGVSDGQNTELLEGPIEEGTELVTNVLLGTETRTVAPTGGFPGLGRGGFGGGNNRGGGNRGGR